MHGLGMYKHPNGYEYSGGYSDGLQHGQGKVRYRNGDEYEGEFKEARFMDTVCCVGHAAKVTTATLLLGASTVPERTPPRMARSSRERLSTGP